MKFVWIGSTVSGRENRVGKVVSINRKQDFAFMRGRGGYWTDTISNLKVISNKEVRG